MTVLFIIIGVAMVGFIAVSMFKDAPLIREKITEEVTINGRIGNSCVIETNDSIMSSKKIENCDLPDGAKVKVSYQKALPTAEIVE